MQILLKIVISIIVILAATAIAKKFPFAVGLIAVMPLTGAWFWFGSIWRTRAMLKLCRLSRKGHSGVLCLSSSFSSLHYLLCFKKQISLPGVLASSFGIWLLAAIVHQ